MPTPQILNVSLTKLLCHIFLNPINPEAKILMLTSEGQSSIVTGAIKLGAKDFIVKPPERKNVLKKIRDAIKCAYTGSLYDFLKDDLQQKECAEADIIPDPPGAA